MIAGAVANALRAAGLSPVRLAMLGDHVPGAGPAWAVHDEPGADVPVLERVEWYRARLQIRARADDMLAAVAACRRAYAVVQGARGQVLEWTDPHTGAPHRYRLEHVRAINRPTWFPTREGGETAVCNFTLSVREV